MSYEWVFDTKITSRETHQVLEVKKSFPEDSHSIQVGRVSRGWIGRPWRRNIFRTHVLRCALYNWKAFCLVSEGKWKHNLKLGQKDLGAILCRSSVVWLRIVLSSESNEGRWMVLGRGMRSSALLVFKIIFVIQLIITQNEMNRF